MKDPCELCRQHEAVWVLYCACKRDRASACSDCVPESAVRISDFAYRDVHNDQALHDDCNLVLLVDGAQ